MASVISGYTFTGPTDPITAAKLNLLGVPTVTLGAGEVTIAKLAPLATTGSLIGSSPTSTAAAALLINNTGLTLHSGVGLTFGAAANDSGIALGQSATAKIKFNWTYSGVESTAQASIQAFFGNANAVGLNFATSHILSVINGAGSWGWYADGTLINENASALATNAAVGFFHVASCAGTPTGTPTLGALGRVPVVYDSSANKIYFYNGSWRGVVVS